MTEKLRNSRLAAGFPRVSSSFQPARCRHPFGPRECSKVMRCLLHPLLHPRTIPIGESHLTMMCCIRYGAEDQRGRLLSSSHRLIVSSFHVSSAHRLIVSSSHLLLTAVTSSSSHCRHIVAFSHLHIISSPHTTNSVSQSHRLIVSSSHLLIVPSSSTINNSSSPHRPFVSSTHRHTVTSSQLRIISSPSHTIARPHRLVV